MKFINFYSKIMFLLLPIVLYGSENNTFNYKIIRNDESLGRSPMYIVFDSQLYKEGGVTFYYPECLFSTAPTVQVLLESGFSITPATYIAEVVSNSPTETVVMVYEISTREGKVFVTEVLAGSVTVSLNATERIDKNK
jgi:hypothetical protein